MSKKDYRKVRAIPGTIFEADDADTVARQRRLGLLYSHGVNPAAVAAGSAEVESLGNGRVRVYYQAIYLPEDQASRPTFYEGRDGVAVPEGVECHHGGGYKNRHTVKQVRSFDAFLGEVLA